MRKLVVLAVFVLLVSLSAASDAVIAYATNGSNAPSIRFWNSSGSGTWGPALALPGSGPDLNFAIIKASPVSGKLVLVTMGSTNVNSRGILNGYVCMSNCNVSANWNLTANVGQVQDSTERDFDLEFETSTGNAILVYTFYPSNASSNRVLIYKILPNTTNNFSAVNSTINYIDNLGGFGSTINYEWVSLERKPANSREMLLAAIDKDNKKINAWVWNGSAFSNPTVISDSVNVSAGDENLAVSYSADGSKGMVIGANSSRSSQFLSKYWDGASWTTVPSVMINNSDLDIRWMTLKADPATDDLQAVFVVAPDNLYTAYWNGSSWNSSNLIERALATQFGRTVDFEWNPSGSNGSLVWDNATTDTTMLVRNCAPNCNDAITRFISPYATPQSDSTRYITLYRDPTDSDTVNILGVRLSRQSSGGTHYLGSFTFNGTNYTNYGDTIISSAARKQPSSSTDYDSYSIAFLNAAAIPNISVVKTHITPIMPISPGGMVQWQIAINNTGNTVLNSVLVMDGLDMGLEYNSSDTTPTAVSVDKRSINWTVGPISPDAQVVILVNSTAIASGTYFNYVNVTGVPASGGNVNDSDNAMVGINSSGIGVLKTVSPSLAFFNRNVTYTLDITNNGEVDLTVRVVDTLPANVTYRSTGFSPPPSVVGQTVTWTGLPLPVGGSIVIGYNVSAATQGGSFTNDVVVIGTPPNGADVNDSDSATFTTRNETFSGPSLSLHTLSLSLAPSCDGNVVTVESGGDPLPGALVVVNGDPRGITDANGQVPFNGCDMQGLIIRASKGGYQPEHMTADTLLCAQCVAAQCSDDSGCPASLVCTDGKCDAVSCSCGQVQNHRCVQYACCSDSGCAAGNSCINHECAKKTQYECANDADCPSAKYCDISAGAAGGSCKDATGTCGQIVNHRFVPYNYECGTEPGCPACLQGLTCADHRCVSNDLKGPQSGFVGESANVQATQGDASCANCDLRITDPSGKVITGKTDAKGGFMVPLALKGTYNVSLLKDGVVVRTIQISSMPKAPQDEPAKPSAQAGPEMPSLLALAIIAVLVVLFIVFYRKDKKKGIEKGKA